MANEIHKIIRKVCPILSLVFAAFEIIEYNQNFAINIQECHICKEQNVNFQVRRINAVPKIVIKYFNHKHDCISNQDCNVETWQIPS